MSTWWRSQSLLFCKLYVIFPSNCTYSRGFVCPPHWAPRECGAASSESGQSCTPSWHFIHTFDALPLGTRSPRMPVVVLWMNQNQCAKRLVQNLRRVRAPGAKRWEFDPPGRSTRRVVAPQQAKRAIINFPFPFPRLNKITLLSPAYANVHLGKFISQLGTSSERPERRGLTPDRELVFSQFATVLGQIYELRPINNTSIFNKR